ncbi:unnamed protein product [Schistocephalus solidus]|uniref:GPI mannosyltransferase 2 n=1 Tax=Schistocephalus solidus TaxID=70667 RepID=A0A183SFK3_SCHSO|nr:unnamed protein product [Schistocephalus solidus]
MIAAFSLLPDHAADAFSPPELNCTSYWACFVRKSLSGFLKWDSIYFHFIAVHGYVLENTLAFFPLLPSLIHLIARILSPLVSFLSFDGRCLLVGVLFNFSCNVLCSMQFYRLSKLLRLSNSLSVTAVLLFIINPASVFFSVLYSEALHSLLLISALVHLHSQRLFQACCLISLSAFCRSNGLVNIGFACYPLFINILTLTSTFWKDAALRVWSRKANLHAILMTFWRVVQKIVLLVGIICTAYFPHALFQFYGWLLYCCDDHYSLRSGLLPPVPSPALSTYALKLAVRTPFTTNVTAAPEWCGHVPLSSYNKIQSKFWNVGFLQYYKFKQIPNFLLAAPVLVIASLIICNFYRSARRAFLTLGILVDNLRQKQLLPHIYHLLFLSLYGIANIHVQVLTRMLFSSCPILYWYCASILVGDDLFSPSKDRKTRRPFSDGLSISRFIKILSPTSYPSAHQKVLLLYFYAYILVGCIMHSNFLPWT